MKNVHEKQVTGTKLGGDSHGHRKRRKTTLLLFFKYPTLVRKQCHSTNGILHCLQNSEKIFSDTTFSSLFGQFGFYWQILCSLKYLLKLESVCICWQITFTVIKLPCLLPHHQIRARVLQAKWCTPEDLGRRSPQCLLATCVQM